MLRLLCFSLGLLSVSLFPQLPSVTIESRQSLWLGLFLITGVLLLFYYVHKRLLKHYPQHCPQFYPQLVWIVLYGLGVAVGITFGYQLLSQQLPSVLDRQMVNVIGVVEGLPKKEKNATRFLLRVDTLQYKGKETDLLKNNLVQLSWYNTYSTYQKEKLSFNFSSSISSNNVPLIQPGQRWQFKVKLRRPRGLVNPSGFDYQVHLLRKKIMATGYVVSAKPYQLIEYECGLAVIDCVRWQVQKVLIAWSSSREALGPLAALTLGDTQWLSQRQWLLLRNTGTVHLIAISGLHIGLAAVIGLSFGRVLFKSFNRLMPYSKLILHLPSLLSILCAVSYALLSGLGLPAQRALVMVGLFYFFTMFNYRMRSTTLLSAGLCLVVMIDPFAFYAHGFWLSFLAVSVLLYGFWGRVDSHSSHRNGKRLLFVFCRYCWTMMKSQWVLAVGLFLPSVILLQGVSVSGYIANLFAISFISLVTVPLLFVWLLLMLLALWVSMPWLTISAQWVYSVCEYSVIFLLKLLTFFEEWLPSFFALSIPPVSWLSIILFIIGVVWLLAPRFLSYRYLGVCCCLPLVFSLPKSHALRITFMDAGQGTAVLVETRNHRLVYDVGRDFSERFNVGEHIVAPYVRSLGYTALDRVIVSHGDSDHAGGLQGLLSSMSVNQLMLGQALKYSIDEQAIIPTSHCRAGQYWQWDNVEFRVLWPEPDFLARPRGHKRVKNNNMSCVVLISYANRHILLTGDIERSIERELLESPHLPDNIDILLVPHHGSKTSSSRPWLRYLQPDWAIVTAGFKNAYRHPHPTIVQRYSDYGINMFNTAESGAIRFSLNDHLYSDFQQNDELNSDVQGHNSQHPTAWRIERWRQDYPRYWYD